MRIEVNRIEPPYGMEGISEQGLKVSIDSNVASGGKGNGFRPMEMLLVGLASCSSIDVLDILKKQRLDVEDLKVEAEGKRADAIPAVFTDIHLTFNLTGTLPAEKVERAIQLSMDKYCSVGQMLNKVANITYSYQIQEPISS